MKRRRTGLAIALLAIAVGLWVSRDGSTPRPDPEGPPAGGTGTGRRSGGAELPRIGLERVELSRPERPVGQRDLFDFGPAPVPSLDRQPLPTLPAGPRPTPVVVATPPPVARSEPSAPPVKVTFIGSAERRGSKVAVLLTDEQEVLTGRVGQLVANRFRIVEIGIESVDIQDVGSDRVRRIPLKGS